MEIVAIDIGGTHSRFAIAEIADGRVVRMDDPVTLQTAKHVALEPAWAEFADKAGRPLPRAAAIAIAAPVEGDVVKLTNSAWVIRPSQIGERLGLDRCIVMNDFVAIGHAVAQLPHDSLAHLCGPDTPLPDEGVVSIIGPGTGLGVACLLRRDGRSFVTATEGGHMDFAPLDEFEDFMLALLRGRYRRVSVERIVAGPGLANIHEALARREGAAIPVRDDAMLWGAALDGSDSLAVAALDRFCLSLGSVTGDIALAHGASAVVIAGGVGQRLASRLPSSGFQHRFAAKGRFEKRMAELSVKLITHQQPGLFGAAAAFAEQTRNPA